MRVLSRLVFLVSLACASAATAADATLFRIFLRDGGVLVSYGEFSRVEDRVIFSMPVGGGAGEPRLQVVWVSADAVDWPRTERYAASAGYQQYAQTRGEEDFRALNDDVARVLNEIAVTTDRARAMELASRARTALAAWPLTHQGYRQDDVREIVGLHRRSHRRPARRRRADVLRTVARRVAAAGGAGADAGPADAGRAARSRWSGWPA